MSDEIPQWAKERACELANAANPKWGFTVATTAWDNEFPLAFARYIAEHEEPPVDPLLVEAREIVKETLTPENHKRCDCRGEIDRGEWDRGQKVRAALAALKRGMELAS